MDDPDAPSQQLTSSDEMLNAPTDVGDTCNASPSESSPLDAPTVPPEQERDDAASPLPGRMVGDYELIREIARGGMGVVFLAKQTKLNRLVALKMVLGGESAGEGELTRFANEARAAAALDHPGIVPVYEVGSHGKCPYFSMGYVDGKSLAGILADGPLEPIHAAEIAKNVALAIAHAHAHKIIHRDLKPANILIDRAGSPKITDFGVCKLLASHSQITSHGELIGTPHYMPPEQAGTPDAVIAPASDVYSIGAVLYAMLTARPPFQAPSPIDVITQVVTKEPVPPSRLVSGVPEDLETITLKCLAKSPKDRYESAQALAEDLGRFINDEPILAKPPGWVKRLHHAIRRHVFLASVSGSLAMTLVVLTVLLSLALLRSRANVLQLRDLLSIERDGARRMLRSNSDDTLSETDYDVRRLSDAAAEFADRNPQLAMHLAVYAGRLALKHDVAPPDKLRTLLNRYAGNDGDSSAHDALVTEDLIASAEVGINRELTEFELAVFGLFNPSHNMERPRGGAKTDVK